METKTMHPLLAQATRTVTEFHPPAGSGEVLVTMILAPVLVLLAIATIFLPFFVWGCYSRLQRLEKLQRQAFADIVNELRRQNGPPRPRQ